MFKKCNKCGNLIKELKNNNTTICCGEDMREVIPNSVDAAFEKHVPNIEIKEDKIIVTVNHVMDDDHYIEWIGIENEKEFSIKKLKSGDEAKAIFDFVEGSTIYSYCNKHSLWKTNI